LSLQTLYPQYEKFHRNAIMKIGKYSLDGASLLIGLIVLGIGCPMVANLLENPKGDQAVIAIGIASLVTIMASLWLSIRIGTNRQRIRDVKRWMGDKSNES
jgi:hypothetical protein